MLTKRCDYMTSKLSDELRGVLNGQRVHLANADFQFNDILRLLARTIYRCSDSKRSYENLRRDTMVFRDQPEVLISTLVVAAVQAWVFDSRFPETDGTDNLLLKEYRKAIMVHGMLVVTE